MSNRPNMSLRMTVDLFVVSSKLFTSKTEIGANASLGSGIRQPQLALPIAKVQQALYPKCNFAFYGSL